MEELFSFLKSVYNMYPEDRVALFYSDKITSPGFSCVYEQSNIVTDKNLDGTTNLLIVEYQIQVWNDTLKQVKEDTNILFRAMEGTKYQIESIQPVRVDGNKRKWHQEITVTVMEDI